MYDQSLNDSGSYLFGRKEESVLQETQEAGIPRKLAPTIGISVDPRRQNLSVESLTANVARLKEYRARLILFPRKLGKTKTGDSSKEDVKAAKDFVKSIKNSLPIVHVDAGFSEVKELPSAIEGGAYRKLRDSRSDAKNQGAREKRAKDKADEAAAAKKQMAWLRCSLLFCWMGEGYNSTMLGVTFMNAMAFHIQGYSWCVQS